MGKKIAFERERKGRETKDEEKSYKKKTFFFFASAVLFRCQAEAGFETLTSWFVAKCPTNCAAATALKLNLMINKLKSL
jgi:hypothetical protein